MKKSFGVTILIILGIIVINSCNNQQSSSQKSDEPDTNKNVSLEADINYLEQGKDMAMQTKSGLASKLVKAITERGSDGAVEFCNIEAMPITDSMSLLLNAHIKRVSDRPRNPANQANELELEYINAWKMAKANGKEQAPIMKEYDGKMIGYYPIVTNPLCMQCHGKPKTDINQLTLNKINDLYPNDQAIGYAENELRGIFVIEIDKK